MCHNLTCDFKYTVPVGEVTEYLFDNSTNTLVVNGTDLPTNIDDVRYIEFAHSKCKIQEIKIVNVSIPTHTVSQVQCSSINNSTSNCTCNTTNNGTNNSNSTNNGNSTVNSTSNGTCSCESNGNSTDNGTINSNATDNTTELAIEMCNITTTTYSYYMKEVVTCVLDHEPTCGNHKPSFVSNLGKVNNSA